MSQGVEIHTPGIQEHPPFILSESLLPITWCCKRPSLRWRHNGRDSVSYHQSHHRLLNCLFGCRSKKTSKLHVTGLCAGNSPGTGEFPAQMASNADIFSIWWCHHNSCASVLFRWPCWVAIVLTLFITSIQVSINTKSSNNFKPMPRHLFFLDQLQKKHQQSYYSFHWFLQLLKICQAMNIYIIDEQNLKCVKKNWALSVKFPSSECHKNSLMLGQNWFRLWLGAIRQ